MKSFGWTMANAYQFVGKARGLIMPNDGFFATLSLFEELLWKERNPSIRFERTMSPDPKWLRIHRNLIFPNESQETHQSQSHQSQQNSETQTSTEQSQNSELSKQQQQQQQQQLQTQTQDIDSSKSLKKQKKTCLIV